MNKQLYLNIDNIIKRIDRFRNEPLFSQEKDRRINKDVSDFLDDNTILRSFAYLIAYSQNANSELVEQLINQGSLDKAFENFNIAEVTNLNPCDIADRHWSSIKGIRQQAKLFHIVSLARKIKKFGSFAKLLNETGIPKQIRTEQDIKNFWIGFNNLQAKLKKNKIQFFQSTTSLLHFLLDTGYDCIKPDLVVMKVARKLEIVDSENSDKNLRKVVEVIQLYSINRNIKPSVVDFYFLIDEGQRGAKKFVKTEYYMEAVKLKQ
jgi:hypothetical protein